MKYLKTILLYVTYMLHIFPIRGVCFRLAYSSTNFFPIIEPFAFSIGYC